MPEMNISKAQFGNTSWNPFSAASRGIEKLGAAATTAVTNSALGQQIQASQQAADAASAAHLEHQTRTHEADLAHQKWQTLASHVLGQEAATSEHGRRLEFFKQTTKHAEPGTGVGVTTGDYKASFTKKTKPVAATPAATTSTAVPVHLMARPVVAAPVQEGPKPTVKRGPGGKMVSLKTETTSEPKPRKKKLTPAPAAPLIGRDPKTGKAISLKKK